MIIIVARTLVSDAGDVIAQAYATPELMPRAADLISPGAIVSVILCSTPPDSCGVLRIG
jgi:hypothetical protein